MGANDELDLIAHLFDLQDALDSLELLAVDDAFVFHDETQARDAAKDVLDIIGRDDLQNIIAELFVFHVELLAVQ